MNEETSLVLGLNLVPGVRRAVRFGRPIHVYVLRRSERRCWESEVRPVTFVATLGYYVMRLWPSSRAKQNKTKTVLYTSLAIHLAAG